MPALTLESYPIPNPESFKIDWENIAVENKNVLGGGGFNLVSAGGIV